MKILIISKYALSKEVGFETRLFAMSRVFVKKGHAVTIISSVDNYFAKFPKFKKIYNHQIIDGIKVIWIKVINYQKTVSFKRVLSWLDYEWKLLWIKRELLSKPDVIIVSSLSLLSIINGMRLKKKFNCKLIFEIRDIWPLTLIEEGGYSPSNPMVKVLAWIERWGYKNSDLVVGTMPNLVAHVNKVTGQEIKTECVPFGFDLKHFQEDSSSASVNTEYNIPKNKFIIGYAGSIGLSNGLDTFIAVIKKLKDYKNLHFIILGGGGLRETYMNDLKECSNVQFIAKVERQEVKKILAQCNLLYFATLKSKVWDYGWSLNKLTDYLMAAKPILASYSGFPSMINEADSGIIVPAEDEKSLIDAITMIHSMPTEELEAMGERGKQWLIQNRQWEKLADDYLSLIHNLVASEKYT
ncbi:MAG TPA: glycosyltransferase family 4 protein [Lutibacter sp.]